MKLAAAPESIMTGNSIQFLSEASLADITALVDEWACTLTAVESLEFGWVGQCALICPGCPQYKHSLCQIRCSLSSDERWVYPIFIGSWSGVVVTAGSSTEGFLFGRLERIKLSTRMASSINWSKSFPSLRHVSSDCRSIIKFHIIPCEITTSKCHPPTQFEPWVWGNSAAVCLPLRRDNSCCPASFPTSACSKISRKLCKKPLNVLNVGRLSFQTAVAHSKAFPIRREKTNDIRLSSVGYNKGCWETNSGYCSGYTSHHISLGMRAAGSRSTLLVQH